MRELVRAVGCGPMTVPMCAGARHVFVVGEQRCRCGAERTAALDPVETRIAGLVVRGTWSGVEVKFLPDGDRAVAIIVECAKCARKFKPMLLIAGDDWKRMRSGRSSAVMVQRSVATRLIENVHKDACGCSPTLPPLPTN